MVVERVAALVNLGVLAASQFVLDLVRPNVVPVNLVFVVEGVVGRAFGANLLIRSKKLFHLNY